MRWLLHSCMPLLLAMATAASTAASAPDSARVAEAPECPPSQTAAAAGGANSGPVTLTMADGQLVSWNLRVFLPQPLPANAQTWLCLLSGHAVAAAATGQQRALKAAVVAQGSQAAKAADGSLITQTGTVVLFERRSDLLQPWKPSMRVWPLLVWTGDDGRMQQLLGEREVTIGQAPVVWALTGVALLVFVALLAAICRGGPAMVALLTADDGHLSLSKLQMALWTVAVGAVVFYFALLRLDVPSVPESLVVLMGLSLATTGISYRNSAATGGTPANRKWRWADLVTVYDGDTDQPTELSLARAQMLFWTGLLLIVFIAKTVLSGVLWDVPWSLVALMGISQAGYLAPKLASTIGGSTPASSAAPAAPPDAERPAQPPG